MTLSEAVVSLTVLLSILLMLLFLIVQVSA